MKKLILIAALLSFAAPAAADSDSIITAGLGTTLGVTNTQGIDGQTSTSFSNELSLRVKALYVLGFEFAYSPTDHSENNGLVFTNDLRMSGLLYFVPTPYVSAYAKAGIEADNFGGLFSISDPSNAYHAGGGLDIEITKNISLGLEFLWLIPGKSSVEDQVETFLNDEYARYQAALSRGETAPTDLGAAAPEVSDFLSASNFRLTVGARYYF